MGAKFNHHVLCVVYFGIIISLMTGLTGCGAKEGAEALGKGYYYHSWDNQFISRKSLFNNKSSVIVDSQVTNYSLRQHKYLLVEQIPQLAQQQWQQHIYWLIDMETH
ncbi:MAG TPA: hypothetical protein ENK78_04335, partial [Thiothrix sp.]|nr:hypothetical protein [Thiothrix sp.]